MRRAFYITLIALLVLLTVQGWSGGAVSQFARFPPGAVAHTPGALWQAVQAAGGLAVYHALEGLLLVVLAGWCCSSRCARG